MCQNKPKLASFYYAQSQNDSRLAQTIKGHEIKLGNASSLVAHQLIDANASKLSSADLTSLCFFHSDVAKRVIKSPKLLKNISPEDLVNIVLSSPDILKRLSKNKKLHASIMNPQWLPRICQRYFNILVEVHESEKLQKNLPDKTIEVICARHALYVGICKLTAQIMAADKNNSIQPVGQNSITPLYTKKNNLDSSRRGGKDKNSKALLDIKQLKFYS
jgi:hypothetical protein